MAELKDYGEPWKTEDLEDDLSSGWNVILSDINGKVVNVHSYAFAERIKACVNACKGIPTEALEQGVIPELIDAAAKAQTLIEVDYSDAGGGWIIGDNDEKVFPIEFLDAALAKLKGEAAADG